MGGGGGEKQVIAFTSPSNLTSNGTLGGDSFAVYSWAYRSPSDGSTAGTVWDETTDNNVSRYPAYNAFDASSSTFCVIPAYPDAHGFLIIYNPYPINIQAINITMRSSAYGMRSFYLQGSNDGVNYTNIEYFTQGSSSVSTWAINVTSYSDYYTYYRFEIDRGSRDSIAYANVQMKNIVVTGTQLV